jgi:hypothetical protein
VSSEGTFYIKVGALNEIYDLHLKSKEQKNWQKNKGGQTWQKNYGLTHMVGYVYPMKQLKQAN